MARIVFGSCMVRYPLGGMLSHVLQYLLGFRRLGHDVSFVERAAYPYACYHPVRDVMGNDPSFGLGVVEELLTRHGLGESWSFVDYRGRAFGLPRAAVVERFRTADLFVDMGTHGAWAEEAEGASLRVLIDGEPGFNQIKMEEKRRSGVDASVYDRYYTNGMNLGTDRSPAPTAGVAWGHLFHPVVADLFDAVPPDDRGAFTTVMNWRSHDRVEHGGRRFGQKDVEFARFETLPRRVEAPMEIAVAGRDVPRERLRRLGWRVRDAHQVTSSFDAYRDYISGSLGEFSVCKNVFVALRSGWFSDRSAAYLAAGRPVVLQNTGFSHHLPVGEGLLAVSTEEEAAGAVEQVRKEPRRHASAARRIAREHLDAEVVLGRFLAELGVA